MKNGVLLEETSRDATLAHIRHLWGYGPVLACGRRWKNRRGTLCVLDGLKPSISAGFGNICQRGQPS